MDEALAAEGLVAFTEVDVVPDFKSGLIGIAQANGFAGLQANTVMFGWPEGKVGLGRLLSVVRAVSKIRKSTILARLDPDGTAERPRRIDVWWRGKQYNGDLMLLLAHLLIQNARWRQARITVRTIVETEDERAAMEKGLSDLIRDARIKAQPGVIMMPPGGSLEQVMHDASRDADAAFLGLMLPGPGKEEAYAERLDRFASGFKTAIFVYNGSRFSGELL